MTILGFDGTMIVVRMPTFEFRKMVKALANMDDDDSEED